MADAAAGTGAPQQRLQPTYCCPSTDIRQNTGPDFSYLGFEGQDTGPWTAHMEKKAEVLLEMLWKYGAWENRGNCLICGVPVPQAANHFVGKNHWKALRTHLNWQSPKSQEHLDSFIQRWPVPGGKEYWFNHVTGDQGLREGTGAAPQPSPPQSTPVAPPGSSPTPTNTTSVPPTLALPSPNGGDYAKALNSLSDWRQIMAPYAKQLEDTLARVTNRWDFPCKVCDDKNCTRGMNDHIVSKDHHKNLWKKLSGRIPAPEEAQNWNAPWVQKFQAGAQVYLFNHVTGAQKFADATTPAAPAVAQPTQPSPPMQPLPTGPTPPPPSTPIAPVSLSPPPIMMKAAPSTQPPVAEQALVCLPREGGPPIRQGIDYVKALNDGQAKSWKVYMAAPAEQLEKTMYTLAPEYLDKPCVVCDAPRNGIANHITSLKHWKQLWSKLENKVPGSDVVCLWDKPWVEKIPTRQGTYLFNHLTGEQGLEHNLRNIPPPPQTEAKQPPATPPKVKAVPPSGLTPPAPSKAAPVLQPPVAVAAPPAAGAPAQGEPCLLDVWVWGQMIRPGAEKLEQVLAKYNCLNGDQVVCQVCDQVVTNVVEHFTSQQHYSALRHRMKFQGPNPDRGNLSTGPWVQRFNCAPVSFNHLTGEVGESSDC